MHRPTPQLVIALDSRDTEWTLRLADSLRGVVPWLKVGLELFVHAGPDVLARLKDKGFKVFLDLKMYDIPNTVRGCVLSAVTAGADMLTVHTQGGQRMARAAVEAAAEAAPASGSPLVLGVTVLTSMAPGELPGYTGELDAIATELALGAHAWGLHGVVCSGHEVAAIKARCGTDFLCLTPGIRPATGEADDQRRVMTPAQAVAAGSNYLVVGRPVTQASDPVGVARAITEEIQRAAP